MNKIQSFLIRVPYVSGLVVAAVQFFFVASVNAQTTGGSGLPGISPNTNISTFLTDVICNAIAFYMFIILIALCVVFILVAAYQYLTSSGDEGKVHDATMKITYAAVAVAVALLAKAFPVIVTSVVSPSSASGVSPYSCQ